MSIWEEIERDNLYQKRLWSVDKGRCYLYVKVNVARTECDKYRDSSEFRIPTCII